MYVKFNYFELMLVYWGVMKKKKKNYKSLKET